MACRLSAIEMFFAPDKKTRPRLFPYQTRLFSTGAWLVESRRRVFSSRARLFFGGAWLPRVPGVALFLRRLALRVPRPALLVWRLALGVPRLGLPGAALGSFGAVRQDPGPRSRPDSMAPQTRPLLTTFLTYQHAILPRSSGGDCFDGIADEHDGAQLVNGAVAWLASQRLAAWPGWRIA
jgi:hypothetical protein